MTPEQKDRARQWHIMICAARYRVEKCTTKFSRTHTADTTHERNMEAARESLRIDFLKETKWN